MKKDQKYQLNNYFDKSAYQSRNRNNIKTSQNRSKQKIQVKNLNHQYFNMNYSSNQQESISSHHTTKMKGNLSSRSNSFRPKFSIKSPSDSEKSTKKQLYKSISRLTSELQNKNKALIKKNSCQKIKEAEVYQLYRILAFYQGKIKNLQKQTRRYEEALQKIGRQCDQKNKNKSRTQQLSKVFQQLKKQNTQLAGKIQQKDYIIGTLQQKMHKLQSKIAFLQSKQSYLRKSNSSQGDDFKIKSSSMGAVMARNTGLASGIGLSLKQKQESYGNIQSKINKIQSNLNYLKKQNQTLEIQLEQKQKKIHEYQLQLAKIYSQKPLSQIIPKSIETPRDNIKQNLLIKKDSIKPLQPLPQKRVTKQPKSPFTFTFNNKTTPTPKIQNTYNSSPQKAQQSLPKPPTLFQFRQPQPSPSQLVSSNNNNTKNPINQSIFRKLKYQLLTEQVSHEQLVKLLCNQQLQPQILQQSPYNLSSEQAQQLIQWVQLHAEQCNQNQQDDQNIKSLQSHIKTLIPKFHNLTIRKQSNIKIQICNQVQNREKEFLEKISKQNKIPFQQIEKYLCGWGLSQSHVDTLLKSYYEETGDIVTADLKVIKSVIDRWAKK